jgi:hypothetical protein
MRRRLPDQIRRSRPHSAAADRVPRQLAERSCTGGGDSLNPTAGSPRQAPGRRQPGEPGQRTPVVQATGRPYWLSPRPWAGSGCARRDRLSLGYLLDLMEDVQADVAASSSRPDLPSIGVSGDIGPARAARRSSTAASTCCGTCYPLAPTATCSAWPSPATNLPRQADVARISPQAPKSPRFSLLAPGDSDDRLVSCAAVMPALPEAVRRRMTPPRRGGWPSASVALPDRYEFWGVTRLTAPSRNALHAGERTRGSPDRRCRDHGRVHPDRERTRARGGCGRHAAHADAERRLPLAEILADTGPRVSCRRSGRPHREPGRLSFGRELTPKCDYQPSWVRLRGHRPQSEAVFDSSRSRSSSARFGANVDIGPMWAAGRVGGFRPWGASSPSRAGLRRPCGSPTAKPTAGSWPARTVRPGSRSCRAVRPANPLYPGWAGWLGGVAELRRYHEVRWRDLASDRGPWRPARDAQHRRLAVDPSTRDWDS